MIGFLSLNGCCSLAVPFRAAFGFPPEGVDVFLGAVSSPFFLELDAVDSFAFFLDAFEDPDLPFPLDLVDVFLGAVFFPFFLELDAVDSFAFFLDAFEDPDLPFPLDLVDVFLRDPFPPFGD